MALQEICVAPKNGKGHNCAEVVAQRPNSSFEIMSGVPDRSGASLNHVLLSGLASLPREASILFRAWGQPVRSAKPMTSRLPQ